jgi:hypothetical protein
VVEVGSMSDSGKSVDFVTSWPDDDPSTVVALLRLAFPEVVWLAVTYDGVLRDSLSYWLKVSPNLSHAFEKSGDALFDALDGGHRRRCHVPEHSLRITDDGVECEGVAAAIDEEEPYAYLHAYLAYRLGFQCHVVTMLEQMEHLFRDPYLPPSRQGAEARSLVDVRLTFEDLFLNFPDRRLLRDAEGRELHLSHLGERDSYMPGLRTVPRRVFVTVGHRQTDWYAASATRISELRAGGSVIRFVGKPSGGLYRLLERSGLARRYWQLRRTEWNSVRGNKAEVAGHGAPGSLLAISCELLDRASRLFRDAATVQDCVQGAMLLQEAQDLLRFKTPTTMLEVIVLRHKLEVKAECMFQGMEYNIDVKNRFREIAGEVGAVSHWFNPATRKRSALNAEMSIITEIMRVFHEYGQFDEELACQTRLRRLNRNWYFLNHPWMFPLRPIRAYIETLLGSFPLFAAAVILWPILLGTVCALWHAPFGDPPANWNIGTHITNAYVIFFAHSPMAVACKVSSQFMTVLTSVTGFVHLGVFVAYLYTLVTRK